MIGVVAPEYEIRAGTALRRHGALGHAGRQGAYHDVRKARMRLGVAGNERARVVDVGHQRRR